MCMMLFGAVEHFNRLAVDSPLSVVLVYVVASAILARGELTTIAGKADHGNGDTTESG